MALKVIGAGFGRTGTLSTKMALEQLGLGKCHHMEEVFANPDQVPVWQSALRGEPVDWAALFKDYGASVDWPSAHYWRELSQAFPDAKVLLTVRDPQTWWASYAETIMKVLDIVTKEGGIEGPPAAMSHWCVEAVGKQCFGSHYTDREAGIRAFERRIEDVREALPADRLLVFEVKQGWGPLCDFLGLPVPDTPFPRSNNREEFWELLKPPA